MTVTHFTLAYWCVLIASLLPIVCAGLAKRHGFGRPRREGGFDNADPRAWLARQQGFSARANAAQANSFEALPFFIGAVLIAHQLGANQAWVDALAMLFITFRLAFIACYLANAATLRTLAWTGAMAANIALLFAGYR